MCSDRSGSGKISLRMSLERKLLEDQLDLRGIGLKKRIDLADGYGTVGTLKVGEFDDRDFGVFWANGRRTCYGNLDSIVKQLRLLQVGPLRGIDCRQRFRFGLAGFHRFHNRNCQIRAVRASRVHDSTL